MKTLSAVNHINLPEDLLRFVVSENTEYHYNWHSCELEFPNLYGIYVRKMTGFNSDVEYEFVIKHQGEIINNYTGLSFTTSLNGRYIKTIYVGGVQHGLDYETMLDIIYRLKNNVFKKINMETYLR